MAKKTKKKKLIDDCVALAIKICKTEKTKCEFCGEDAQTAHHIIHQARSNYLRCDQKNLVSICGKCHCKIHIGNSEGVMNLQLTKMRGEKWRDYILANKSKTIKSDIFYWTKMKILLDEQYTGIIK